ncbi:MAG: ECF transporter S component, partial [Candidatus Thorarchaeota archaeon]|nr:ECF transporter S component [Candidatus Thorarchaeota archaeon]
MEMEYFRPSGKNSAVNIALLAIMAALVTIMTLVIRIPYPGTSGYFNFGDTMVMLSGFLLGPIGGFFAGGVGSAVADVVGGYPHWAPFTFIIKGFEGMA